MRFCRSLPKEQRAGEKYYPLFGWGQASGTGSSGIKLWLNSPNNDISNNEISNADFGIYLYGSGYAPDDTYISNNNLINIQTWDLLIDEDVDDAIIEDQIVGSYKIVDSNIIVKSTGIGEVWLNEDFSVSGDSLCEDIHIEDNFISIDVVSKPNLNVPGTIVFYWPSIEGYPPYYPMMNGAPCPDSIYSNFQQSGDTLFSFDVTQMALEFRIGGTPNTIEVTEPDSSTIWYRSPGTRTVSWEYGGTPPGGNVSIDLYRDFEHVANLVEETPNNGFWSFSSELPVGWESGDDYRVLIVDDNDDQGWSAEFIIDMETGIEGPQPSESAYILPVSPNPNPGQLSLGYYLPSAMDVRIGIYDIAGRHISHMEVEELGSGFHQFHVDELPSGIYIFQLKAGSDIISERFVVLR